MEKSALAQEKVWFDKPSYDKAERLYFEKMAKLETCFKVVSHEIMESCSLKSEISISNNCQDILNSNSLSETKSKKLEDNKLLVSETEQNDILKYPKNQRKVSFSNTTKGENEYNMQKKENLDENQKSDNVKNDIKEKETNPPNDVSKKCNTKVKGKKNKVELRHKNRGKGNNDIKEIKENITPLIRNIQQLPNQGNQQTTSPILSAGGSLANEVAKARQHIKQSLQCMDDIATVAGLTTPNDTKKDNADLAIVVEELRNIINELAARVKDLEDKYNQTSCQNCDPTPTKLQEKTEDDDDVDLFGSDSEGEDAEAAKIRKERLAAYAAKKSKKPVLIAKSNIILDVKPWDDETDMWAMECEVRKIETDGLLWGAAKLVPLAFGIHKLQISCVVEDEKVSVDWLTEKIQENEEFVQSVDIAAFNKV